jgi:hypothetical protein
LSSDGNFEPLLYDKPGKLFVLSDKEKELVKLVLSKAIGSKSGKDYIAEKLGIEYVEIAENLIKEMETE